MGDITFNAKKATRIINNADIDLLIGEFSRELDIILKGENKVIGTGLNYTFTTMSLQMYDPKAGFNFKGEGSLKIE